MAKKKGTKKTHVQQTREYVAFLKKRLESKNYKNNSTKDEYEETKAKYEKEKFKLRNLE